MGTALMNDAAEEASERLTAALNSLILAAHGLRVPPSEAYASDVGRMEVLAGKIESLAQVIEDETLYVREGQR